MDLGDLSTEGTAPGQVSQCPVPFYRVSSRCRRRRLRRGRRRGGTGPAPGTAPGTRERGRVAVRSGCRPPRSPPGQLENAMFFRACTKTTNSMHSSTPRIKILRKRKKAKPKYEQRGYTLPHPLTILLGSAVRNTKDEPFQLALASNHSQACLAVLLSLIHI